jgi:MFS transporter, SP family, arabinose:H+ symporter
VTLLWSLTSALAGFLFGFDTVVVSGAEKDIQSLWHLGAGLHGVAIASALYGTVLGALFGAWPADRIGRRRTLILIGGLYFVGALWSALATSVYGFIAARALGGLGIGMSTIVAPMYIAEIAPADRRGSLTGLFQFNIVLGIVIAYLSNALLAGLGLGADAWRWMIGIAAIPSLLYTLLCIPLPESPRWLLSRTGDRLGRTRPPLWDRTLRRPVMLAVAIAFFNQMSGINAILYYAPRIFELTGLGAHAALLQSSGIGLVNLVFTFIGLRLIDRLGRRTLLYIGCCGYIVSLAAVTYAFFSAHFALVPLGIFVFIAAHAIGQGVTIWVYIAEIFPDRNRAEGQALGSFTHWVLAAALTTVFPAVVTAFPPAYVFAFFTMMMVIQLIWVRTSVVETKGIPLEAIAERLSYHSRIGPR